MKGTKKIRAVVMGAAAIGAIAMAPLTANANDHAMHSNSTVAVAATPVTGSVVRYYIDRTGYVTAADVLTSTGTSMVRFSPYMGQRLYTAYPVGSQASLYVVGDEASGWHVVGTGVTAPSTVGWVPPQSDLGMLDAEPFILTGQKMETFSGNLSRIVTNDHGEVIGLVLDNRILVRVPRQLRHGAGATGTDRQVQLFKGARVEVRGWEEAPRYGSLSSFEHRVAGQAFIINGKNAGAIGFPRMKVKDNSTLLNVDIGGQTLSNEEVRALDYGYTLYTPAGPAM